MTTIEQKTAAVIQAKQELEKAIFAEIDTIARRHRLTAITVGLGTTLRRGKQEVDDIPEITDLETLYCEHVHDGGFQALWSAAKGWH